MKEGKTISKVWVRAQGVGEPKRALFSALKERNIPYQTVPEAKLRKLSAGRKHQGIVALLVPLAFSNIAWVVLKAFENQHIPLIVACDGLSNVGNIGAIARTCLAVDVTALLLVQKGTALLHEGAIKASAGALLQIPLCRSDNLYNTLLLLKNSGLKIVIASEKAEKNYLSGQYTLPLALVVGDEEKGVSSKIIALADEKVRIPTAKKMASLNVSCATAVMLYEIQRQRNAPTKPYT